jgi:uncharacterized protein (TIGR00369 family)
MPDLAARAAALRAAYNECFGCGTENPIGLHLDDFAIDEGELTAHFVPRPEYRGFAGILHGGILAALLDETLAWTAMMLEDTYVVTANLELKFRKPARVDARYRLRGRVVQRRGRRLQLAGEVSCDGVVVAEAQGLFLATEPIAAG